MKKPRIIFYAGKGGVGKTTHAAAAAVICADKRYSTLLLSTDSAHSLSDLFQLTPTNQLRRLESGLDLLEVDPYHELQSNWGNIREYLSSLLVALGAEETIASELAIIPGMDNLFSLLRIGEYCESGKYDVIVVDMAPTADSLRLLSLPQLISSALNITRYLEKYLISPVVRPASRMSKSLQRVVAPADVARSWEKILERILKIKDFLDHRSQSSVRLVMTPEKLVLSESQRLLTYLSLFGLTTEQVIVNRIFDDLDHGPFIKAIRTSQYRYLDQIRDTFAPLPVSASPFTAYELIGTDNLRRFGIELYDGDPTQQFYSKKPVKVHTRNRHLIFSIAMPFVDPAQCSLMNRSNELMIGYGSHLRSYVLPDSFAGYKPDEAFYNDGYLEVVFRKPNA